MDESYITEIFKAAACSLILPERIKMLLKQTAILRKRRLLGKLY
jgi:hypothetical protein